MKPIRVIESKVWVHRITGRQASIYGACPWVTTEDKGNWEMETRGWTLQYDNGTVGNGRSPYPTKTEAETAMRDILRGIEERLAILRRDKR